MESCRKSSDNSRKNIQTTLNLQHTIKLLSPVFTKTKNYQIFPGKNPPSKATQGRNPRKILKEFD